ncbi:alanine dehydrogenase [Solidesulfovibrio carbinoliphilus subsp. oakridgensis]|uniref:Alanine dehydrogenase n=1 Tax=Solidesulfovibrio carbinoliphilus subsp. oakridgensis TaxID=694327 RepID=G7Q9S4_9BACT|nr:alanine dehydrogenase [Solidesulfovibrio carbinoliphilus]EHJ49190.1 alanine dehydrogenase [Solidesulfovibrio carbinoliphilus subsp. oakridgensis]
MIIGIPKEIKTLENRVAMTPGAVASLARRGHTVLVEAGAGLGSGLSDEQYAAAGAKMVDAAGAWGADMVIKVKEPIASEYQYLRKGLLLFTYLHLAADRPLTDALLASGTTGVAYETVQLPDGTLPLLVPMSEVAGRMAPQVGAHALEKSQGGRGVLLGGVPGVPQASVVVVGAGVVGSNACKLAVGMGAQVTVLDVNHARLQYLDDIYQGRIVTMASNEANIRKAVTYADLLIGAVLIPGAKAPHLVTRDMLPTMKEGSVIVDVAVDQGGCVETIKATTHAAPTYVIDGVVHYGVANMPGAVPRTSTYALCNQTLPYALRLAAKGLDALREDCSLALGLNTVAGKLTFAGVAEACDLPLTALADALA